MTNDHHKSFIRTATTRKQIFQAIGLSLLLLIVSISFIYIPTTSENADDNNDYKVDLIEAYNWDMSSGLTLSSGLDNLNKSILSLSVSLSVVDLPPEEMEVTCEGDCDDGFAWSGSPFYFLSHNVSHLNAYINLETNNWLLQMSRPVPFNPWYDIFPELLSPMYFSLIQDVATITELSQIEENQIDTRDLYKTGTTVLSITHFYNEGSLIHLELINTTVIIRYERFVEYSSSFTHNAVYVDHNYPEVYFMGEITNFFPNYFEELNTMIESVLGG
jgi:hypothetical protein